MRSANVELLAGFTAAGVTAGLIEALTYGGAMPAVVTLHGLAGLLAGAGAAGVWTVGRRVAPPVPRVSQRAWWLAFFTCFLLAFLPFPIFHVLTSGTVTITDPALQVRFTSAAAILGLGAALGTALALAGVLVAALGRLGLFDLSPGPAFFWVLAFPLPWLLLPFVVVSREPEAFAPAARVLYPALILALGPPMAAACRRLPGVFRAGLAGALSLGVLVLAGLLAAGPLFPDGGVSEAPFASTLYARLHRLADLDGDGYTALFDHTDCDEGDPAINRMAFDRPGDGIDQDCDGADATARGGLALGDPEPVHFEPAQKYNILFIMVDALRADHLHFMGYERETSPNLDRLAKQSLVFTNAISQYPSTGISVPSMLAGRYPEYMKWGKPPRKNAYVLEKENRLITDVLARNGYHTRAYVSAWIKRNIKGLGRHFDKLIGLYPHSEWKKWVRDSSKLTVSRAIEFFEAYDGKKPFFLFLHFEDPHEPYVTHDPPGRNFGRKRVDRYDSDIYWTDLWLGFLLGYLEQKPWFENTIIVVTADHGEEFKEHGKGYHGHQIYQESIWVPMVIKAPGLEPGTVTTRVGSVDLFPTLLDLTGIEHDRGRLQGVSLLKTARHPELFAQRPLFSMLADREKRPTHRAKAVLSGPWKLIHDLSKDKLELYNLDRDPAEKHNLATREPEALDRLHKILQSFLGNSDPSWKQY